MITTTYCIEIKVLDNTNWLSYIDNLSHEKAIAGFEILKANSSCKAVRIRKKICHTLFQTNKNYLFIRSEK